MQEDFLHHVWRYQKFKNNTPLITKQGQSLQIISIGKYNQDLSGPDFFNATIIIENQVWAGNVEIHLKSSDWYAHNHEINPAFDNVILHVVWEDDVEIYRKNQSIIASLELKDKVDSSVFINYNNLINKKSKIINCEGDFPTIDNFTINNWLERLFIERIENKSKTIESLLKNSNNNWEEVMFKMLCKSFGLHKNGHVFYKIAESVGYKIIAKYQNDLHNLEALLLGQSNLLNINSEVNYIKDLQQRYDYLKHKHQLKNIEENPQFYRLRPNNFPSIRLAQLAAFYHKHAQVFQILIQAKSKNEIYKLFTICLSEFWNTHYSLTKESKPKKKCINPAFIDLILINTIIPLKFCYYKYHQQKEDQLDIFEIITSIQCEQNAKIKVFENLRKNTNQTALHSQGLLELKNNYCDKNRCLHCHLGKKIINHKLV